MTNSTGTAAAWKGPELTRGGGHIQALDIARVRRLARELPTVFEIPHDEDATHAFRSRMVELTGDIAVDLGQRLRYGPGLAVVSGPGLDELTDGQLTALLYGLSVQLGRTMGQNPEGELIVSVLDDRPTDIANARGYRTNERMLMHTDAADAAGLVCLSQSTSGGSSLFASSAAVHDVLTDAAPGAVHMYHRLWHWDLRGLQRPGVPPTLASPIFSSYGGELSCRYGSLMLRRGAEAVAGKLTAEEEAALDLFEEVSLRPELTIRHNLLRGESVWMNNYRVLHGREEFDDSPAAERPRHLLRTWIWLDDSPPLAPRFAEFSQVIDWALGGHTARADDKEEGQ